MNMKCICGGELKEVDLSLLSCTKCPKEYAEIGGNIYDLEDYDSNTIMDMMGVHERENK